MNFDLYVALGDSMSIDCYPAMDAGLPGDAPVGAAALLYKNDSKLWPDFNGRDLFSANPKIQFCNLCVDGATTWNLAHSDLADFVPDAGSRKMLITLTVGGNDALQLLSIPPSESAKLVNEVDSISARLRGLFDRIATEYRNATVILNSIYDPSDGTGKMDGKPEFSDKIPFLQFINFEIKKAAEQHNFLFADIHKAFLGHGVTSKEPMYYWAPSPIEPSALGASMIRKLWLEALGIS